MSVKAKVTKTQIAFFISPLRIKIRASKQSQKAISLGSFKNSIIDQKYYELVELNAYANCYQDGEIFLNFQVYKSK